MFLTSLQEVLSYHVLTGLALGQTEFLHLLRLLFWRKPRQHFRKLADTIEFAPLTFHLPTSVNGQQLLKLKQHRWIKLQKKRIICNARQMREWKCARTYIAVWMYWTETVTPFGSIMNYGQTGDIAPLLDKCNLWRHIVGGRRSTCTTTTTTTTTI